MLEAQIEILRRMSEGAIFPDGQAAASFEAIPMRPGTTEIAGSAVERFAPIAKLLRDRQGLALELEGQTTGADRPLLASQMLLAAVIDAGDLPSLEGAGLLARRRVASALRERAAGETVDLSESDQALLARYVESQAVPEERFRALAVDRGIAALGELIAAGAPEEALSLAEAGSASSAEQGELPGVRIALQVRQAPPLATTDDG